MHFLKTIFLSTILCGFTYIKTHNNIVHQPVTQKTAIVAATCAVGAYCLYKLIPYLKQSIDYLKNEITLLKKEYYHQKKINYRISTAKKIVPYFGKNPQRVLNYYLALRKKYGKIFARKACASLLAKIF